MQWYLTCCKYNKGIEKIYFGPGENNESIIPCRYCVDQVNDVLIDLEFTPGGLSVITIYLLLYPHKILYVK